MLHPRVVIWAICVPQERNRPSEQRRLRKLMRRNRSHNDLRTLSLDLKDSRLNTLSKLYSAFPPVHPVDHSVDTALCKDALARIGMQAQPIQEVLKFIVENYRREK